MKNTYIGQLKGRTRKQFKIKETIPEETVFGTHGWTFTIWVYDRWITVELPSSTIAFVNYNDQVIHLYEDSIGPILYEASKNVPR